MVFILFLPSLDIIYIINKNISCNYKLIKKCNYNFQCDNNNNQTIDICLNYNFSFLRSNQINILSLLNNNNKICINYFFVIMI